MTMDALAEKTGVNRMTVQRVETGVSDVRLQTLQDLLRALGLELLVVPAALRLQVEQFLQSEGRVLGQPVGAEAPPSIVDQITRRPGRS